MAQRRHEGAAWVTAGLVRHSRDRAEGGLEGLAERALHALESDGGGDTPAYICGESFGGPIALTLARRYPSRVRGLVLLSTFGWYPARLSCNHQWHGEGELYK